ncbi:hypothetical protein KO527_05105 [Pseudoalteromonas sp. C2R02]|uniref:hypothetical protein n=1 Tax=Pseudoalteromonas sp. C2R02 TaxID=2841565 RepID=UPI001C08AC87|nr:hypothetical protein [Pseudoalteromonas sp. C2R02]MBU2968725.1 hypothetical protein [Pseudoalteromonas sp. C2R02]
MENSKTKIIGKITDTFNLFKEGRIDHQNFKVAVSSVQKVINSPIVQQGLKLGELFGYFGHDIRSKTGKLKPSDVEFIDGVKHLVIPDFRTVAISCSDEGIVTHTQEIFPTDGGRAAMGMIDRNAGGWSWASNSANGHTIMTDLAGFDYVKHPNYISTQKAMMLASAQNDNTPENITSAMIENGLDEETAALQQMIFNASPDSVPVHEHNDVVEELELTRLIVDDCKSVQEDLAQANKNLLAKESDLKSEKDNKKSLMLACINMLPIKVSAHVAQEAALSDGEPNEALQQIFKSVGGMTEGDKMMLAAAKVDQSSVKVADNTEETYTPAWNNRNWPRNQ